ncbi:MAG: class I SAM-dependent methyltransferase, partial [Stellaceae bacterium]
HKAATGSGDYKSRAVHTRLKKIMRLMSLAQGLRYKFGRRRILSLIPRDGICAEIGVWKGDFSQEILRRNPKELHLIDPWLFSPSYPQRYYGGAIARNQHDMDAILAQVKSRFGGNPEVKIHRKKSFEAARQFPEFYFDWVYIDGDHSYEAVLGDLVAWYPKVKHKGIIALDDYEWHDEAGQRSVKAALNSFLAQTKVRHAKPIAGQFVIRVEH